MGNSDTKLKFRQAIVQLTTKTQPVEVSDEAFWNQFWSESVSCIQDVFTLIPAQEIRALREENPSNLATLCYKAVEKLVEAGENGCRTQRDRQTVLNCVRLLIRILPYIFEDPDWRGFFWSTIPGQSAEEAQETDNSPLAQTLLNALSDLLFCPEFTVAPNKKAGPDNPEDMSTIDSCEYIWEAGVGFAHSPTNNASYDMHRMEILKLLLTCFSESMYQHPLAEVQAQPNPWIAYFTSTENRHALPLFTSLLNTICAYDPVGYGLPYNHLMFSDTREPLVEVALQVLCVSLENDPTFSSNQENQDTEVTPAPGGTSAEAELTNSDNLFVNYMSRIHREEDFAFMLKGLSRLLNNPLLQTYLPGSCKRIHFQQELLVLFWKMCDINKKFMFYVLKSSDVLEVLVPILYYLNDARADQSRAGLIHIGVFILLLLSGERNFGVRLNKPYNIRVPMDIPVFTGTHADFMIIVFHKIITAGHARLQPLFECLLTVIVNVSPYLKTLSMVASTKLIHLLEAFSTPWFLYASPTNHHLVFFLLEVFNNIIQYQFDGNSNLVYTIIRKRHIFHQLANLPIDHAAIAKALAKRQGKGRSSILGLSPVAGTSPENNRETLMEGSNPAQEAEPGTLKATLAATPGIDHMTEKSPASVAHVDQGVIPPLATPSGTHSVQPGTDQPQPHPSPTKTKPEEPAAATAASSERSTNEADGQSEPESKPAKNKLVKDSSLPTPPGSPASEASSASRRGRHGGVGDSPSREWVPSPEWVQSWKQKLPLQTIMRLLQVLVPQVEKICIDKGLTDESEILKFLQHGTLVGLLPVPHPILIRKYQSNTGTTLWFRTYMWGVIFLRNVDPPIWYDTDVKLFEIQRV